MALWVTGGLTLIWPRVGGGKITPRPIFQLPLPNRLEVSQMLWWLFLDMAGLQNGAKFIHLPPPLDPIWRPEVGSTFGILPIIVVTRVWSGLSAKFQRLYPCFWGRPDQICHCWHRGMLTNTGYRNGGRQTGSSHSFSVERDNFKIPTASSISDVCQHWIRLAVAQMSRASPKTWF